MRSLLRRQAWVASDRGRQHDVTGEGAALYGVGAEVGPAVRTEDLTKTYGSVRALKSVSMSVPAGSVHALVGENGAGKSTMLGILAGRTTPSGGRIEIYGSEPRYGDPRAARRAGVVAIYQELTIVPALSAEANVFLPNPVVRGGMLSSQRMRARYVELCEQVGVKAVSAGTPAGHLSVAEQQLLEILRALVSDTRIILFDEPTASLAVPERRSLLTLIRDLRERGVTIIFVSHNLDEVLEIADDVTVFRNGHLVISDRRPQFTKPSLVRAMIGNKDNRVLAEMIEDSSGPAAATRRPARPAPTSSSTAPPVLAVSGLTVPGAVEGVELEIHAGEILGIGGLVGSGRTTVLRSMSGLEPRARGRMWLDGREVSWPHTVRQALRYGIALVPEDRKAQGLVLSMSAMENIAMSDYRRVARAGFVTDRMVERATQELSRTFGLQEGRLRHQASKLSGGNQQKLLIARWQHRLPRVLLADEPTRGIDVGVKTEVLSTLESMVAKGLALVLVSSELEEVTAVAHRVLVLSEGAHVGTLIPSGDNRISVTDILHLAFRSGSDQQALSRSLQSGA